MKQRIITGILLAAIIVPIVIVGKTIFLIFSMVMSAVAAYEMMNMFYQKSDTLKLYRYIIPILSALTTFMVYQVNVAGVHQFWLVVVLLSIFILSIGSFVFIKESSAQDMMNTVFTIVYTGLIIGYVMSIRYIGTAFPIDISPENPINPGDSIITYFTGGKLFAYLYLVVIATDMFAYFIGVRFGKHRLAPHISPKKSIEGAVAGLIGGGIVGTISAFAMGLIEATGLFGIIQAIGIVFIFSMLVSFMVQIGDLVASKLKRTYDIKDFGSIFPGHGGVLDRFDSLIFSGAFFYIIIMFIQLQILL